MGDIDLGINHASGPSPSLNIALCNRSWCTCLPGANGLKKREVSWRLRKLTPCPMLFGLLIMGKSLWKGAMLMDTASKGDVYEAPVVM